MKKMSWTIYLQNKDNPKMGRKVDVEATSLPKAQQQALKLFGSEYKLYGYDEDYFKKD